MDKYDEIAEHVVDQYRQMHACFLTDRKFLDAKIALALRQVAQDKEATIERQLIYITKLEDDRKKAEKLVEALEKLKHLTVHINPDFVADALATWKGKKKHAETMIGCGRCRAIEVRNRELEKKNSDLFSRLGNEDGYICITADELAEYMKPLRERLKNAEEALKPFTRYITQNKDIYPEVTEDFDKAKQYFEKYGNR